jgi:AraC-like DNA-binding protein
MPRPLITPESAGRVTGVVRVAPDPRLAAIVEQHWIVGWDFRGAEPVVQEVLPDPCVNLAVEPEGVLLHGVTSGRSTHLLAGAGTAVGTKFRPGGFSGLIDGDVQALTDRVVRPVEVFGPAGAELERSLAAAARTEDLIALVTEFLLARLPPPDPARTLVANVVAAMRDAPLGARVADIAAQFAITQRTLQRLFTRHVGATPKQVLQRFRHQRAVDVLDAEPPNLARVAAELGYFDQSHFVQDFRVATGRPPSRHLAPRA